MKKNNTFVFLAAVMILSISSAQAEYRVWTDNTGKTIEAELLKVVGNVAVLKKSDGEYLRVSMSSLSKKDLHYIELTQPPKVEISVSKVKENRSLFSRFRGVGQEEVQVSVKIRKISPPPYSGKLSAILLVIGRNIRTDEYVVLDRIRTTFNFTPENSNTYEFSSPKVRLTHSESGIEYGGEYEGYLVGVLGPDKRLIAAKGSRALFEEHAEELITLKRGVIFNDEGTVNEHGGISQMGKDVCLIQMRVPSPPRKGFFSHSKKNKGKKKKDKTSHK